MNTRPLAHTRCRIPLRVVPLVIASFLCAWSSLGCTDDTAERPPSFDAPCETIADADARAECRRRHGVRLTVLHTSDWHSRLLPYDLDVLATDERLGLLQTNEPFGGAARMAHILKRERANSERAIHVNSGDCFQGAPIFNEFLGEAEIRAMNEIGTDAFVIGNHEFDNGTLNVYDKLSLAQFPVLAANYRWKPNKGLDEAPTNEVARPYTIIHAEGVRIGVIGIANFSSLSSISYADSSLGIQVLESVQTVQAYVDLLRPQVNVIAVLTHAGLGEDEEIIRNTTGVDIVFGGHLHVVLNPPKLIPDKEGRLVPLVHSGAFMKYVGRLDAVFAATIPEEPWNLELLSHDYEAIPIDSTVPSDPDMEHLLADYERELARRIDLRKVVGYTPEPMRRFGNGGGDSPLGNFLADAMLFRERVEADLAATNSLGIRADINRGEITIDQMYNVFPFPNTITTMTLSGNEVQELFDFNTFRSAGRGCATQLQVSGIEYTLDCDTVQREVEKTLAQGELYEFEFRDPSVKFAKDIRIIRGACANVSECTPNISVCTNERGETCELPDGAANIGSCRCREELQPGFFYKFATNNYMAGGGSGFRSLRFNTTQHDTGTDLRDAIIEAFEQSTSCEERCVERMGDAYDPDRKGACAILELCRQDISAYNGRYCAQLERFSERDFCLEDAGASRCMALRDQSDRELCLAAEYPDCDDLYYRDEILACRESREAEEGLCSGADDTSPLIACVEEDAPHCLDESVYDASSPYDECLALARHKAEVECPEMACPTADSDGRQRPRPPSNDPLELEGVGDGGSNPVQVMKALQAAGHDACY